MEAPDTDELFAEQVAYYRADAAEMDTAVRATLGGHGESEYDIALRTAAAQAREWLTSLIKEKDVLEIAAGTGIQTEHIARHANSVVALDVSPESMELARGHLSSFSNVEFLCHDVFDWSPPRRFEVVVFTFFLSHVPDDRFEHFWDVVSAALLPGGVVGFVDARAPDPDEAERWPGGCPDIVVEDRPADGITVRRVPGSGEEFRIVRVLRSADELIRRLSPMGWTIECSRSSAWLLGRGADNKAELRRH